MKLGSFLLFPPNFNLLNKVPGYWFKGKTDLANKPRNMQIFLHSKFGINRTTGSKVMAKKLLGQNLNFLAITFEPAVRFIPNFECRKICMFLGLFAKSVSPWSKEPGTLFSKVKIWRGELKTSGLHGMHCVLRPFIGLANVLLGNEHKHILCLFWCNKDDFWVLISMQTT